MIRNYKKNATVYGREFTLTEEEFISVASSPCAYCGTPPRDTTYGVICNGIDRIDNSRGYTPDNVAACCTRCNIIKGNMSVEEMMEHVRKIVSHMEGRFNDHPETEYTQASGNESLPFNSGR